MHATAEQVRAGEQAIQLGSLTDIGAVLSEVAPDKLLHFHPETSDDFRFLAICMVLAPYFSGGVLLHDVQFCAEHNCGAAESDRDRMFVALARGMPDGQLIDRTIHLPGADGLFAATQWVRICHRKRATALLEMAAARVFEGGETWPGLDLPYEQRLAECALEDLWLRKDPGSAKINLSELMATVPRGNPDVILMRRMEYWRMFHLNHWDQRRDRIK